MNQRRFLLWKWSRIRLFFGILILPIFQHEAAAFLPHTVTTRIRPPLDMVVIPEVAGIATANPLVVLSDYSVPATSLFNNMKLPAAVVTAGMISLGFATGFPELPLDTPERTYTARQRQRCERLKRLHIVMALISITSEIIVVMWAAVEVNQLTERVYQPAASVWDLIQRDCDLAWSAVNSHFVLGIIGFVSMLAIRAYVLLLAAEASRALMSAAMTGTAAALCLMISIVNRGVESGGGDGIGYGSTILDLFQHYIVLLAQCATDASSPGPLELSALVLESASIGFVIQVILFQNDKMEQEDGCPIVYDIDEDTLEPLGLNGKPLTAKEQEKMEICLEIETRSREGAADSSTSTTEEVDTSVNIY